MLLLVAVMVNSHGNANVDPRTTWGDGDNRKGAADAVEKPERG